MNIKAGMYVRLGGKITKLKAINECTGGTYYYFEDAIFGIIEAFGINHENNLSQDLWNSFKNRVRYSFNIMDLIEVGDILHAKSDDEYWTVQNHFPSGDKCIYTEWKVIENEEQLLEEIDEIITKEQAKSISYKLFEEGDDHE
jgi:hypothetical protein